MKAVRVVEKSEMDQFESVLSAALRPVSPRVEFVSDLKQRLDREYRPTSKFTLSNRFHLALLAVASVLSGVVLILNGARMVLSFIAALGFWREMRRHSNQKRLPTLRPGLVSLRMQIPGAR